MAPETNRQKLGKINVAVGLRQRDAAYTSERIEWWESLFGRDAPDPVIAWPDGGNSLARRPLSCLSSSQVQSVLRVLAQIDFRVDCTLTVKEKILAIRRRLLANRLSVDQLARVLVQDDFMVKVRLDPEEVTVPITGGTVDVNIYNDDRSRTIYYQMDTSPPYRFNVMLGVVDARTSTSEDLFRSHGGRITTDKFVIKFYLTPPGIRPEQPKPPVVRELLLSVKVR